MMFPQSAQQLRQDRLGVLVDVLERLFRGAPLVPRGAGARTDVGFGQDAPVLNLVRRWRNARSLTNMRLGPIGTS